MTAPASPLPKVCRDCDRPWGTYTPTPCPKPGDCWECDMFAMIESEDVPPGTHWDLELDVDEVVSYQCPHGTEWDQLCKGCGHKVGGWGMGAAGFGELCGCEEDQ